MRIAVVGSGGVGGYFGGRLARAGHEVAFLARGRHLAALRESGLQVCSPVGDYTVTDALFTDDSRDVGPVDTVLCCVKTHQLPEALEALRPLLGPGTAVVTVQNGVDAPEQVAAVAGRDAVLPGSARIFAYVEAPGRIRHLGSFAEISFGEWDGRRSPRAQQLTAALTEAGVSARVPEDVWVQLWTKFLFVVPFGGLGAATDLPVGELRAGDGTRRMLVESMTEIRDLALARGVPLPADVVSASLAYVDGLPAEGTTSLHRDLRAGRPSELDSWTGAVVRIGSEVGVPTPVQEFVLRILQTLATRAGRAAPVPVPAPTSPA